MASGVGFSIQENYLYLYENFGGGAQPLYIIIRSLTTCVMHGLTVAMLGYGIQTVKQNRVLTYPALFGLFSLAVTIHALFNLYIDSPLKLLGMLFPALLFLAGMLLMKDEGIREK